MNQKVKDALEKGFLRPALFEDGSPMVIEGTQYFEPTEFGANMAIGRYHIALDLVRMHEELRISFEQLNNFLTQMDTTFKQILSASSLDDVKEWAMEGAKATSVTRSRIAFGRDTDQVLQIAAIWFVGENEDPGHIGLSAINEKVELFMKRPDLYGFFLSIRLNRFLHSSAVLDSDTLNSSHLQKLDEMVMLHSFLSLMQKHGIENELTSSYFSRIVDLMKSANFSQDRLNSTTKQSAPSSEMSESLPLTGP